MATFDQINPSPSTPPVRSTAVTNPLSQFMARAYTLNWEVAFYVVLLVIAVLTRFVGLGDRVMSHDESLHVKYSYDLWQQGIFQHTPLMHGPVLFHMTAASYFLFGDSDFTGRLYPAILGIIMIFMPKLLFERWLGKYGAMISSVLITISPMLLFHSRYIREDTPAIFFTILMAYSIFAYLDGVKPRQLWHLVLFSAATLLNLASKETAFMYIAVFGFILTVFVLIQLVQGWRQRAISPVISQAVFGLIAIPIASLASTLILRKVLGDGPFIIESSSTAIGMLMAGSAARTVLFGLPLTLLITAALFVIVRIVWSIFSNPGQALFGWVSAEGNSLFKLVLAGIILGTVVALSMTVILSIIKPETIQQSRDLWTTYDQQMQIIPQGQDAPVAPTVPRPETMQIRLAVWTGLVVLLVMGAIMLTAVQRFSKLPSLPWRDIIIVLLVVAVWATALVIFEERSRNVPNVSSETRPLPASYDLTWVDGAWLMLVSATLGVVYLRFRTTFWQQVRRYPAFDLAVVLGSLVIPWLGAIPLFLAGFQLDVNSYTQEVIQAMFVAEAPFVLTAVAIGLAWNPMAWLVCAGTFYSLFAFFYTTIFTNIQGIGTGLVGSLGYWLTQQGVKRGSQPQYYYLLIELPIYEYLLMIGGAFAGILGLSQVWRFRAERVAERLDAEKAKNDELAAFDATGADVAPAMETDPALHDIHGYAEATAADTNPEVVETTDPPEVDAEPVLASLESEPVEANAEPAPSTLSDLLEAEAAVRDSVLGDDVDLAFQAQIDENAVPLHERLQKIPFVGFVGYWAVLIIMALTAAGEKMPWLTTHIALPLCLVTGWYIGTVMESVDWKAFFKQSWVLLIFVPVLVIGAGNVFSPVLFGGGIFSGLSRDQLLSTFTWMGAILLTGMIAWGIWRVLMQVGLRQAIRVSVLGLFVLLGILTARTAWNAAYLNYDLATEFMVYAHGAPANKTIINYMEDISRRTTDGMNIKVAYDDQMSWPGSWYYRNFPNARFLGNAKGATDLDQYVAIAVGTEHAQEIEPQLGDNFQKFDLIRLWWPMQDYFDLNLSRVDNALADPNLRKGLWDIWLNRDYKAYAAATGSADRFDINVWPVVDRMVFYVRKDVAAQMWDFGVGGGKVSGLPSDAFANLRCDTCAANFVYDTSVTGTVPLNYPRGVAVDAKGNTYIADSRNGRIVIFTSDGKFSREISTKIDPDPNIPPGPGNFPEPWGVDVDADGNIYVADTWYHRVLVFTSEGQLLRQWGSYEQANPTIPGTTTGFYGPRDIKVDAFGNVYVADTGNKRVRVYDKNGNYLRDIGTFNVNNGNMKENVGIAINNELQEVYIASTWSKKIEVYSMTGEFKREWAIRAWAATTESTDTGNRPFITLDKTGRYLFVTDPDVARVLVFEAATGNPVLQFGRLGTAPYTNGQFGVLGGITTNTETGQIYLVDAGAGRILRFDPVSLPGLITTENQPVLQPTIVIPTQTEAPPVETQPVEEPTQEATAAQ